jgi:RNA polymerase sigma-70 factor (ECF subfamily)
MPTEPSDEALLSAFAAGDESALGELARRYETALLGLARGMLGGRNDLARDAVQETWVRVMRYGHGFQGRSSVRTWLYRIAINRCRDLAARDARRHPPVARRGDAGPPPPAGPTDDLATLQRAVDELAAAQREAVLLCYHRGMTHTLAAEILDIPVGTLKSRLHAALGALREELAVEMMT